MGSVSTPALAIISFYFY